MNESMMKLIYEANKKLKIGQTITCPTCDYITIKKTWNQAFCCTKCRQQYWNTVDPERAEKSRLYAEFGGRQKRKKSINEIRKNKIKAVLNA